MTPHSFASKMPLRLKSELVADRSEKKMCLQPSTFPLLGSPSLRGPCRGSERRGGGLGGGRPPTCTACAVVQLEFKQEFCAELWSFKSL